MDTKKVIKLEKEYIMQTYSRADIVIEYGDGCYVFDKQGKKYIDLVGGLATCILGHGNIEFAEAVKEQIRKITNPTNLYYTEEQVKLAEKLAKLSGLKKCFFSNSGAESVEAAIKLVRKHNGKKEIIATKNSFHGRTFGSLTATGKNEIREPFKPLLPGFKHIEYGNPDAFRKAITKKTAAIIIEPIQGEAGIIVPNEDYLKNMREVCNKHNILMIVDEVQTGCGRTGRFFAYEHSKIKPDIVTLAKGLANGIPIGATIAREDIAASFVQGEHGSTFGGNPVACKAANFTVDYIIKNRLIHNAAVQGNYFIQKLYSINSKSVKEARGKGLMIGLEVKNKASQVQKDCLEKGLIINLTAENVLRFLPSLTINKKVIDDAIEILGKVMENES